jgi:hypothetical protein
MKRVVLLIGISIICTLTVGCAPQNENEINLDEMKASEIVAFLSNLGYPVSGGKDYDGPGDTSQYPWNIKGCTSAAEFWIPDGTEDGESIGVVEVYSSVDACKDRRDQAAIISSFYTAEPYYVQVDKVFLQVPKALPEKNAVEYKTALIAMSQGNMPEPPSEGITYYTGQWTGYVATFPEYVYAGTKDASFADRHFRLKDTPQNIPEEFVALHFYYDIAGEYDKLYNLCGSESLQISATNTEKNFRDGLYKEEYIVSQLSTLSVYEFVNMDSSILELIKYDIEMNDLAEYTFVRADFTMTSPAGQKGQAELLDGDHTFYFLCGKNQTNSNWKLYEVYWK